MLISNYIEKTGYYKKSEVERVKLVCFFASKEYKESLFSISRILDLVESFGSARPNGSRLKTKLTKGINHPFVFDKNNKSCLSFSTVVLEQIENEYGTLWEDHLSVFSNSELIDEEKYCGRKYFLTKIIKQINHCYENNCYDACAVLMRRLFEILLILTYIENGIESEIKNADGRYMNLDGIVKNVIQNKKLCIPNKIAKDFVLFKEVGNNSAHSITYTAGKKDVDDIKNSYRLMIDDLYNRANLLA